MHKKNAKKKSSKKDVPAKLISVPLIESIRRDIAFDKAMKKKLNELIIRFEALGLGMVGNTLVWDFQSTSSFIRFGQGRFRTLPLPFSLFVGGGAEPSLEKLAATGCRTKFFGVVHIWKSPTDVNDADFEQTMIHEFIHASKKFCRCLNILNKHFQQFKYMDENAKWWEIKDNRKYRSRYLVKAINEGFAYFSANVLIELSGSRRLLEKSEKKAEQGISWIKEHLGGETFRRRNWGWIYYDETCRDYVIDVGINFFIKADSVLRQHPSDYLDYLFAVPPNPDEILTPEGGRKWAERIIASAACRMKEHSL